MVSKATVKKVAEAAKLNLSTAELKKLSAELEKIISAFSEIEKVAIPKDTKPSFQPMEIRNVMRKDKPVPGLPRKHALANTKQKERGYFRGPKAV